MVEVLVKFQKQDDVADEVLVLEVRESPEPLHSEIAEDELDFDLVEALERLQPIMEEEEEEERVRWVLIEAPQQEVMGEQVRLTLL